MIDDESVINEAEIAAIEERLNKLAPPANPVLVRDYRTGRVRLQASPGSKKGRRSVNVHVYQARLNDEEHRQAGQLLMEGESNTRLTKRLILAGIKTLTNQQEIQS